MSPAGREAPIDLIKALASNLILVYHLALYGPMSDAIYPAIKGVFHWIHDYPPMLVQCFLVIGGYLAGRSLERRPAQAPLGRRLWHRYVRLAPAYAVALVAAIAAAALARLLIEHADTPAAPTPAQLASHVLLLHDILGQPSLSLGVWYVAIDFQLYAMLLLTAVVPAGRWRNIAVASLVTLSLLWWNRVSDLDMWAPYFFGAYGMGYLVQRVGGNGPRAQAVRLAWAIGALALVATAIDWRGRLLVAVVTALLLLAAERRPLRLPEAAGRLVRWLGGISYPLFLLHYPVALVIGTLACRWWGDDVTANFIALGATWLATLAAATLVHAAFENRSVRQGASPA